MSEALFKIGSVYRQRNGRVVMLEKFPFQGSRIPAKPGRAYATTLSGSGIPMSNEGARFLESGRYVFGGGTEVEHDLIPGELEFREGQWLPITEQARSPYFAEAVESEWVSLGCTCGDHPADLAMIARDGPARPAAPVVIQEPTKTSHGPIAGLTVVAAVDHRLGSAFRF